MNKEGTNIQGVKGLKNNEEYDGDNIYLTLVDVDCTEKTGKEISKSFKIDAMLFALISGQTICMPIQNQTIDASKPWVLAIEKKPNFRVKEISYQTTHTKKDGGCEKKFKVRIWRPTKER